MGPLAEQLGGQRSALRTAVVTLSAAVMAAALLAGCRADVPGPEDEVACSPGYYWAPGGLGDGGRCIPARLHAPGHVTLSLDTVPAVEWHAGIECITVNGGSLVEELSEVAPLAELDGQPISVRLSFGAPELGNPLNLEILQAGNSDRQFPFRFYGLLPTTKLRLDTDGDRTSGQIAFEDLSLMEGPAIDLPGRPTALTGRYSWQCDGPFTELGP